MGRPKTAKSEVSISRKISVNGGGVKEILKVETKELRIIDIMSTYLETMVFFQ